MLRTTFTAALVASLAGFCLSAQTVKLEAHVPFEFQMGKAVLPAGDYSVTQSGHVLILRNESGKASAIALLGPGASRKAAEPNGVLVFNKYGEEYFLSTLWAPNATAGVAIPKTAREREAANRAGPVQTAGVSVRGK